MHLITLLGDNIIFLIHLSDFQGNQVGKTTLEKQYMTLIHWNKSK